jgi:hypothetical protein
MPAGTGRTKFAHNIPTRPDFLQPAKHVSRQWPKSSYRSNSSNQSALIADLLLPLAARRVRCPSCRSPLVPASWHPASKLRTSAARKKTRPPIPRHPVPAVSLKRLTPPKVPVPAPALAVAVSAPIPNPTAPNRSSANAVPCCKTVSHREDRGPEALEAVVRKTPNSPICVLTERSIES